MSSRHGRFVLAATLTISIMVSGCSPSDQTTPPPTSPTTGPATTTPTVTSSRPPRPTIAPPVAWTFDIAPYRNRTCDLLTRDQQGALGLAPQSGSQPVSCDWKQAEPSRTVTVSTFVTEDFFNQAFRESNDYRDPDSRTLKWEIFEPRTVAGQPAVVASTSSYRFNCGVIFGTGPKSSIWVVVIDADRTVDSCPRAVAISEQIIHNLAG